MPHFPGESVRIGWADAIVVHVRLEHLTSDRALVPHRLVLQRHSDNLVRNQAVADLVAVNEVAGFSHGVAILISLRDRLSPCLVIPGSSMPPYSLGGTERWRVARPEHKLLHRADRELDAVDGRNFIDRT